MLLLDDALLDERRAIAGGALARLTDSLAAELDPLLHRELYLPRAKALLSRAGGRCERDGTALEFDPYSPEHHRCPQCGMVHTGAFHHRWWVYSYQLWLAERAVHAALLFLLRGQSRHGELARAILHRYADQYADYPNRDNVLGPTRLFFSTYIESIWLLQICVAGDLMRAAGDPGSADEVRERIIGPSAALIAQYDEGFSNRQVWNNAALMAAALSLGDRAAAERIVRAPSGVEAHLAHGLLSDSSWYEGENYHLFAHRGLWYCVILAERAGIALDPALVRRFNEGFAVSFATALPDFTLPARKDSQYAVSLHQWRFAELCELGIARTGDSRLPDILARLYGDSLPAGDTGRSRSTADVEHNTAGTRLARADLGWRSLLCARAALPVHAASSGSSTPSVSLDAQGITVFRRAAGDAYVALDWGQSGGGHGHPDRLNVLFSHGDVRWLDDLGTGSYTDPSLRWYRSTLAHNAPLVNGRSQLRMDGTLLAYEERDGIGWAWAAADDIAPGVQLQRTIVVMPGYFIDELHWAADGPARVELPIHFDAIVNGIELTPGAALRGGHGLEDGFDFAHDVELAELVPEATIELSARRGAREARAFIHANGAAELFRARAPGQPATETRRFLVLRSYGAAGAIRSVWSWSSQVERVDFGADGIEVLANGERHSHVRTRAGWRVEAGPAGARRTLELRGRVRRALAPDAAGVATSEPAEPVVIARDTDGVSWDLGEAQYRRSEESWTEAGTPRAHVTVAATQRQLTIGVVVEGGAAEKAFARGDAENPYDNEHPDIAGHGVQLYVRTPAGGGGWVLVPEEGGDRVRARSLTGWGDMALAGAAWRRRNDGYELTARIALPSDAAAPEYPIAFDVLINETAPGRERRRGQLVLSGAHGEFVYLRGDRHDPGLLVRAVLVDRR